MKVSQAQKDQIRQNLLKAAVDLFIEKGFAGATMREISSRAGYSPGTIYSYFPNKEKIFFAYFDQKQEALFELIDEIEDFEHYNIKEKLQTLLETQLEIYLSEREFVETTFKALMDSPMKSYTELKPAKDRFVDLVEQFLSEAISSEEVSPQPFKKFLAHLFWDYKNLMVLYWLRDDSPGFTNTSRLIDITLDIYVATVQSGIVTKTADVVLFLVKSHLYGNIERLFDMMSIIGGRKSESASPKSSK